jgi:hypothetical protein
VTGAMATVGSSQKRRYGNPAAHAGRRARSRPALLDCRSVAASRAGLSLQWRQLLTGNDRCGYGRFQLTFFVSTNIACPSCGPLKTCRV